MLGYISVALGGAVGATTRYTILRILDHETIPYGTVVVNIAGSFIMGMIAAAFLLMPTHILSDHSRSFITVGVLGGFTTFSAFSWDTLKLLQSGENLLALFYLSASVIGSLIAVFIGYSLMKNILI